MIKMGGNPEGNLLNTLSKDSTPPVEEPIAINFIPEKFEALNGITSSG